MSNHRKFLIAVTLILVALFLINKFWMPFSNWWYLAILVPYTVLLSYNSLRIRSNFYMPVISSSDTLEKKVALTFDDGPDKIHTTTVLNILKTYGVKGTFFCIGKKINESDDILQRIDNEGHIIGNHSFVHNPFFDFWPPFLIRKDLHKTNHLIEKNINKKPKLFRPPFGVTTPSMALAVKTLNLTTIGWDNRSFDTVTKENDKILERIIDNLRPGGIILLHDIYPKHATLLPDLIKAIRSQSYNIVPLNELLDITPYE